ncbi:DUF4157 domain-containing protein [Amycolatopsis sp. NBC_01307]|uniref:DUF4157 domain-containing protein n=1 Tax=Amycolatopsis sp. NBC_01307 TaxID=2903561 RepID=UPI002E0F6AE8|nr:DUF4157 domain-containing protein [Amycolatopsis sp. NBC_01307]
MPSWPFRRRTTESVVPEPPPSPRPPSPAAPRPSWAAVAPLRPTIPLTAPLVGTRLQAQPEIATTRPLLVRKHVVEHDVPVARGLVHGLATPRVLAEPDDDGGSRLSPSGGARPPVRPAPAAPRLTHPVLTRATDSYVGEAREPAEPFRAPAWLRATPPPAEDTVAGAPLPAFLTHPSPTAPPEREPQPRRRNLGQSRRVGLGQPSLSHPQGPEPVHPADGRDEGPDDDGGGEPPETPPEPEPPPPPPRAAQPRPEPVTPPPVPRPEPVTAPARPAYRVLGHPVTARLPERPEQFAADLPAPVRPSGVPGDIADHFQRRFGTDVTQVPVHRGPEVSHRASALNARAFTARGEVYLPAEAGPIDGRQARSLLAHELTHVVQQRTTTTVAHEHSAEGRRLENQARQTERDFGGDVRMTHPAAPPRLPAAAPADVLDPEDYADRIAEELVRRGIAHRDGTTLVFGDVVPDVVLTDSVQRAAVDEDETRAELKDLFRDINIRRNEQVFEPEEQARALAHFLASNEDLVPLRWENTSETELKYELGELAKQYNLLNPGSVLSHDSVEKLAAYLWETRQATVFGDPASASGEEVFGKDRELETYGQWGREVGLGLAETWGGMLGFRFDREAEREILGLAPEADEKTERSAKAEDGPGAGATPAGAGSPSGRRRAADPAAAAAAGKPAALPRFTLGGTREEDPDPPEAAETPGAAPASRGTAKAGKSSLGLGGVLDAGGTTATRKLPAIASSSSVSRLATEKEEAEEAKRERAERKLDDFGHWGREVGLDLAETWGGMLGFRLDRKTEREVLDLPPEPETKVEEKTADDEHDDSYLFGGLRGDGPVVRTGPGRTLTDSGRPQIDPADIDSAELVAQIYRFVRLKLNSEVLVDRERHGWLRDIRF